MPRKLPLLIVSLLICQAFAQASLPPFLSFSDLQKKWIETVMSRMTVREKIGQLFMVAVTSNFTNEGESLASQQATLVYSMDTAYVTELITTYHVGGIIFLRKNDPKTLVNLLNYYQRVSKIPLLVGLDAEWGLSLRLRGTIRFPRALTLGAIQDSSLIEKMGEFVGKQCRVAGVHWNFAPVVDVNSNPRNPVIHDRSFGDDPQRVADLAKRYMYGLRKGGVLTCVKHFPGHGDTDSDSHYDLPCIGHSRDRLNEIELLPFKELINAGVDGVMGAHLSVPALGVSVGKAASLSKSVMFDLLRKELQFTGLTITDGLGMNAITHHYQSGEAALQALLAGNDMILCPVDLPAAVARIEQAINEGLMSQAELDQRVFKILKAKASVGLDHYTDASYDELLKLSEEPQAGQLKQDLYAQAIAAVNGAEKLLPLVSAAHETTLVVFGAQQESVFARMLLPAAHMSTCDDLLSDKTATHVIIAVLGMNKYAQQNFGISVDAVRLAFQMRAQGKKVIVVLFGTPYSVALFPQETPILIAYEDDPDAQQAVAEILLGKRQVAGQLAIRFEPNCLVTPSAR